MNWEAVGAIGEIFGAMAVVATLFYLASQIRQGKAALDNSTLTSRASLSYQAARNRAEQNAQLMENPQLLELLNSSLEDESPEFTPNERLTVAIANRFMMQGLDADYILYSSGLLEEEYWNIRLEYAKRRLDRPYIKSWWEKERMTANYSPAFLDALDAFELPQQGDA